MLKLSVMSAAFFIVAASGASACVAYDGSSDAFTNNCGEDTYVEYRTVGGGCYTAERGAFSFRPNETHTDAQLSEPCGTTSKWRVDWSWCGAQEWSAGTCKPKF